MEAYRRRQSTLTVSRGAAFDWRVCLVYIIIKSLASGDYEPSYIHIATVTDAWQVYIYISS